MFPEKIATIAFLNKKATNVTMKMTTVKKMKGCPMRTRKWHGDDKREVHPLSFSDAVK